MPELPEVFTTVLSLNKVLPGLTIRKVWSSYHLPIYHDKNHLKSPRHYKSFKNIVEGAKVKNVRRRGKNILIDLESRKNFDLSPRGLAGPKNSNQTDNLKSGPAARKIKIFAGGPNKYTILVHMKMTGHFLLGRYEFKNEKWRSLDGGIFDDPRNQFIRMVFSLSNGKQLAFSDLRKFAKVLVAPTSEIKKVGDLEKIGPEPLVRNFSFEKFRTRLMFRPHWKIKQALLDQSLVAGIGNIYSDEILWAAGVHPFTLVEKIPALKMKKMFSAMKKILPYAISLGGDSTSDFRRLDGTPGGFQGKHHAYRKTGKPCDKKDGGVIRRLKMGGRSAHYCDVHQKLK